MNNRFITMLMPLASILVLIAAFLFIKPQVTGFVVQEPSGASLVNADVSLTTKEGEALPPDTIVEVAIDERKAAMTVQEFIRRSGLPYEIGMGPLESFGSGVGYTGNHSYNLTLAEFPIDRNIGKGEHIFTTRILLRGKVLFEREKRIVITSS